MPDSSGNGQRTGKPNNGSIECDADLSSPDQLFRTGIPANSGVRRHSLAYFAPE
jgi:hypothetical protein